MRKLLLILSLLPAIALANPQMYDEPLFGGIQSKHHRHGDNEDHLPRFLHRIDLSDKQQAEIKTLVKAHRAEIDAKLGDAKSIWKEIRRLSLSNDYSDEKVQVLFDKAAVIHRETALQKSRLDNAIFKLLTGEQQKKLQSQFED